MNKQNRSKWLLIGGGIFGVGCLVLIVATLVGAYYFRSLIVKPIMDMTANMPPESPAIVRHGDKLSVKNVSGDNWTNILITLKTEEKPTKAHGSGLHRDYYLCVKDLKAGQTYTCPLSNFHSKYMEKPDTHEVAPVEVVVECIDARGEQVRSDQTIN